MTLNRGFMLALFAVIMVVFIASCASADKPKPKEGIHGYGYNADKRMAQI